MSQHTQPLALGTRKGRQTLVAVDDPDMTSDAGVVLQLRRAMAA